MFWIKSKLKTDVANNICMVWFIDNIKLRQYSLPFVDGFYDLYQYIGRAAGILIGAIPKRKR